MLPLDPPGLIKKFCKGLEILTVGVEMFVLWAITKYEWISISIFLTVFIASSKHFIYFHINKRISSSNSSPM